MLRRLLSTLAVLFGATAERFRPKRLVSSPGLAEFVRTRSAYVAQTSLYGYLKTRMGTSFQRFFEDETYSSAIRIATVKLFVECAADLAVFAAATATRDGALSANEAVALARYCHRDALDQGLQPTDRAHVTPGTTARFEIRTSVTDWTAAARGEGAFAGSCDALIRFAPVIEDFKRRDGEIVRNSIRFRWRDVREQLRKRIDPIALAEQWRTANRR